MPNVFIAKHDRKLLLVSSTGGHGMEQVCAFSYCPPTGRRLPPIGVDVFRFTDPGRILHFFACGAWQVVAAAKARGVEITALLCTHKHWDHSGGNEAMKKMVSFFRVDPSFCDGRVGGQTRTQNRRCR